MRVIKENGRQITLYEDGSILIEIGNQKIWIVEKEKEISIETLAKNVVLKNSPEETQ